MTKVQSSQVIISILQLMIMNVHKDLTDPLDLCYIANEFSNTDYSFLNECYNLYLLLNLLGIHANSK